MARSVAATRIGAGVFELALIFRARVRARARVRLFLAFIQRLSHFN